MPYRDGTGPFGLGPGTGRGRGWCRPFSFMRPGFGLRRIGFLGALIPVAAAALQDLANPNGLLRSASRKLIAKKLENARKPIDASYTILGETKSEAKQAE